MLHQLNTSPVQLWSDNWSEVHQRLWTQLHVKVALRVVLEVIHCSCLRIQSAEKNIKNYVVTYLPQKTTHESQPFITITRQYRPRPFPHPIPSGTTFLTSSSSDRSCLAFPIGWRGGQGLLPNWSFLWSLSSGLSRRVAELVRQVFYLSDWGGGGGR